MSGFQRSLSFLSIAQRCAENGEKGRAIITVINALRNHPECIDSEPSPVDFIADIYVPGFEEELNRLRMSNPHFWDRFARALYARQKEPVVTKLQKSFEKYCIEQMQMTHASYGARPQPMYQHQVHSASGPAVMPMPQAAQNGFISAIGEDPRLVASSPSPRSSQEFRRIARPSSSGNGFVAIAQDSNVSQFGNTQFDIFTHADRSLMDALQTGVPEPPCAVSPEPATSMEFDGMRIPLTDAPRAAMARVATMPSIAMPDENNAVNIAITPKKEPVETPSHVVQTQHVTSNSDQPKNMHHLADQAAANDLFANLLPAPVIPEDPEMDMISQVALNSIAKRQSSAANNEEVLPISKRFERLRAKKKETKPTQVYTDADNSRVIYDFDDKIGSSLVSSGPRPYAELTPIKSYEQELEELRASSDGFPKIIRITEMRDPADILSDLSAELNENVPQATPLEPIPSVTFSVSSKQLAICVTLCVIVLLGFITWKLNAPNLEREAMTQLAAQYFEDAQNGKKPTFHEQENGDLTTNHFASNLRSFLDVWSYVYFTGNEDYVFDSSNSLTHPSEVTAYILWLIENERVEDAKRVFLDTRSDTWRGAEYFKKFSEALLAEASLDYTKAAQKYAKLASNSSISSFAIMRLALLAARTDNPDVRTIYEKHPYSETEPVFSKCVRSLFTHGEIGIQPQWNFGALKPKYANMCGVAASLRYVHDYKVSNASWTRYLEKIEPDETLSQYRLEALIENAMAAGNISLAAKWFAQFETSPYHPDRSQLQHEIIQRAFEIDDLKALSALNSQVKSDLTALEAASLLDSNDFGTKNSWATYATRYGEKKPGQRSGVSYEASMDFAWSNAVAGNYPLALSELKSIRNRQPNAWEPLMLQAEILYHEGRAKEAAGLYEVRAMHGEGGIVSIVMSNLYRTRAGLTPNPMAYGLPWIELTDPTLEVARCEVLENTGFRDYAKSCRTGLEKRKQKRPVKSAWMAKNAPKASLADLQRAGTGALSAPGYHKRNARLKMAQGAVKEGLRAYSDALLFDPSTATVDTIRELEKEYDSRNRLYEGAHAFEDLIKKLQARGASNELLAAAHHAAATMYQPKNGSSEAKRHLVAAIELIGDNERSLTGIVQYYSAKDNPKQLAIWQSRLQAFKSKSR